MLGLSMFDFTIRADPGVSAGFGLGAGSITVPGGAAGVGGGDVIKIPMKPFSPFNGSGKVEKRPSGPYAASFDARGSNWAIEWSARQMGGEQREVKITPEMQQALDKLRQQAGKEPPESKAKPKEPAPKEPLPSERKFKPGEWEKLSPEEQKAFVDQYMKERNIPRLPTDTNDHHVWPKYLGGPEDGPLETLDERLHQLFHAGLDRVLPRTAKGGQEYYASLSEAQKIENIKSLLRYTRDFDVTYGTKVYEKLLQALKGSQYEALPGTL